MNKPLSIMLIPTILMSCAVIRRPPTEYSEPCGSHVDCYNKALHVLDDTKKQLDKERAAFLKETAELRDRLAAVEQTASQLNRETVRVGELVALQNRLPVNTGGEMGDPSHACLSRSTAKVNDRETAIMWECNSDPHDLWRIVRYPVPASDLDGSNYKAGFNQPPKRDYAGVTTHL